MFGPNNSCCNTPNVYRLTDFGAKTSMHAQTSEIFQSGYTGAFERWGVIRESTSCVGGGGEGGSAFTYEVII